MGKVTFSVNRHEMRDTTVQIVALPMVYGIMSFKCVVRMWQISCADPLSSSGEDWKNWWERREILWNVYRSNLNVADVYEAWALLGFAWMTIRIINKELLVKVKGVKHNVRILRHRMDDRSLCEQSKLSMSELEELAKSLQESVGQLTVQGIHAFVLVCFVEAFYGLFLSGCEYYDLKNWVDY